MEIVNLQYAGAGIKNFDYSDSDNNLIRVDYINSAIGEPIDYIEYFIYDESDSIISSNYNYENYKYQDSLSGNASKYSAVLIDPVEDIKADGIDRGTVNIQYNLLLLKNIKR